MTKYDWPLYGVFKEARIRRSLGLSRTLKQIRHRLIPDKPEPLRYSGYRLQFPEVRFEYQVGATTYTNRILLDGYSEADLRQLDPRVVDAILSNIGMAFLPLMFSLGDFRTIQVDALNLDESAKVFFGDIILKSLAEWHFCEGLPVTRPISITSTNASPPQQAHSTSPEDRALLLNGGGKDSALSAELIKRLGMPFDWLTIDPNATRRRVIQISGQPSSIELRVQVDPRLRETPAYLISIPGLILFSFVSLLPAYIAKSKYVLVGNEYSANFGNTIAEGVEINHQFCKTHEYEVAFGRYARSHILADVAYVSILRPLYELRIGKLFAKFPQYFGSFLSCNAGQDSGRWCKRCAKCAFVFLSLAPFVAADQLLTIFGEDLLESNVIRASIVDLAIGKMKPWECVGTREECALALALTLAKFPNRDFRGWPRRKDLEKCCRGVDLAADRKEYLESFKEPHLLPEPLARRLQAIVDQLS